METTSKEDKNIFLKYGDKIMLFHNQELLSGQKSRQKNKTIFHKTPFLSSHGYFDDRVRLQFMKYSPGSDTLERGNLVKDGYFRDKIFIVTPKLKFNFYQEMKKHKRGHANLLRGVREAKRKRDIQRFQRENEDNVKNITTSKGKNILFGEDIHFVHAESGYFLEAIFETGEVQSFTVKLSRYPSRNSVFKMLPLHKSRQKYEKIQYEDGIKIFNTRTKYFLNYTLNKGYTSYVDLNASHVRRQRGVYDLEITQDLMNAAIIYLTRDDIIWSIKHIANWDAVEDDHVKTSDIVRINFPHMEAELSADYAYEGSDPEVYCRKYNGPYEQEIEGLRSVWMIHSDEFNEKNINCSKNIQEGDSIIFQHFLTSKIMSCPGGKGGIVLTPLETQALELKLYPIIHDQLSVRENRPFQIVTTRGNSMKVNTEKVLTRAHLELKYKKNFNSYSSGPGEHFNPLMDDSIEETRWLTEITKGFEYNEAHCLNFEKIT